MKKLFIPFLLFFVCTFSTANAQFIEDSEVVTAEEIEDLDDETIVTLKGYIVEKLDDEDYLFRDDTGEIEVEIEDEVWNGQEVDKETEVRIQGEIDDDLFSTTIEVQNLQPITLESEQP